MPLPVPLPDKLMEEVLLRLPPDIPASNDRAGLCRLLSAPEFCRRFLEFHRSPPVLGFLHNSRPSNDEGRVARFVPTSASRVRRADNILHRALDSRHGRVLLVDDDCSYSSSFSFVVYVPVADERWELL
ncbi:hypothetical protein U9M48_004843 [Paspalum notatum var. saurae]|uniref:F-box domain-containing protein n=1 Tax=Paspalum notatum var. saurae TaxID=547442 RepID=A0AAQ3PNS8_PASNO